LAACQISLRLLDDPASLIDLIPNLVQIKTCSESYNPTIADQFNTLSSIDVTKGYWVNVASSGVLEIEGNIVPQSNIELQNGWNFVSYLPQDPLPVSNALSSILPYLLEVRSGEASWIHDQLNEMRPGKAYWIKVDQACSLEYPQ